MAATSPFVVLVDWIGWREAIRALAGLTLLVVMLFYAVVRDRPEESTKKQSPANIRGEPFSSAGGPSTSFEEQRLLDHFLWDLCAVRDLRRLSNPLGGPISHGRTWSFCHDHRATDFSSQCGNDPVGSAVGSGFRQGFQDTKVACVLGSRNPRSPACVDCFRRTPYRTDFSALFCFSVLDFFSRAH